MAGNTSQSSIISQEFCHVFIALAAQIFKQWLFSLNQFGYHYHVCSCFASFRHNRILPEPVSSLRIQYCHTCMWWTHSCYTNVFWFLFILMKAMTPISMPIIMTPAIAPPTKTHHQSNGFAGRRRSRKQSKAMDSKTHSSAPFKSNFQFYQITSLC